jgi:hypothetical protein
VLAPRPLRPNVSCETQRSHGRTAGVHSIADLNHLSECMDVARRSHRGDGEPLHQCMIIIAINSQMN